LVVAENRKKELLNIVISRIDEIVSDAFSDMGHWDDLLMDEEISEDELTFIMKNCIFEEIKVDFKV